MKITIIDEQIDRGINGNLKDTYITRENRLGCIRTKIDEFLCDEGCGSSTGTSVGWAGAYRSIRLAS